MHLQQGAVDRQGRAQFVRGVAHEPLLGREGPLQPVQHLVEGVRELLELVVRPVQLDPPGQVGPGHPAGGAGDPAQGREHTSGHGVAEGEGDDAEAHEGQERPVQKAVEGVLPLRRGAVLDHLVELGVVQRRGQLRAHVAGDLHARALDLELQPARVVQRLRGQHVDDRQQQDARDQEHAAVQQREPYPDGRAQPGVRGLLRLGFPGRFRWCLHGRRGGCHPALRSGIRSRGR